MLRKRYGMVIKVKEDMVERYIKLHKNVWPEVLEQISNCSIKNYSIYLKDGYLFSYFDYYGEDFEADTKKMSEDAKTQEWWKLTNPCQEPIESRKDGEWWADMQEVFHMD